MAFSLFGDSSAPKPVVQTNTTKLSKPVKKLTKVATKTLTSVAKDPHQLDLPAPVPFNETQLAAQQQALGSVPAVSGVAQGAAGATNFLTNPDILSASANPYLGSYIDAALRPITTNFTTSVLPNIRGSAIANSGLGGSRQGISEGLATGNYLNQLGDTTAKIASEGYGQGLQALQQGVSLAPGTANLQTAPAQITGAVGQQQYDLANTGQQRQIANQYLPFITAQDVLGAAGSIPGASTGVSTVAGAPTTKPPGTLQAGLGGAALGASVGGPWGALLGGGLGALSSILG